jgi:GH18 family chitinase
MFVAYTSRTAGPWQQAFSNMASTAGNRKTFINNMMQFMDTYGFDGMDVDWEYPSAGMLCTVFYFVRTDC